MEVKNSQTCSAAAVTTFLRKFRIPAMIDPMIPGNAAAALPASRPRSLARALSLFLTHSLTLLGFFGGVVDPTCSSTSSKRWNYRWNDQTKRRQYCSDRQAVLPENELEFFAEAHVLVENFFDCLPYPWELWCQLFTILTYNLQPRGSLFF